MIQKNHDFCLADARAKLTKLRDTYSEHALLVALREAIGAECRLQPDIFEAATKTKRRQRKRKDRTTKPKRPGGDGNSLKPVLYKLLGITVDRIKKTVSKGTKIIEFERSEVQWHIFNVALTAHPGAYSLEGLNDGYPGESDKNSRKAAITHLNRKLRRVGLRIEQRTLAQIGNTSE